MKIFAWTKEFWLICRHFQAAKFHWIQRIQYFRTFSQISVFSCLCRSFSLVLNRLPFEFQPISSINIEINIKLFNYWKLRSIRVTPKQYTNVLLRITTKDIVFLRNCHLYYFNQWKFHFTLEIHYILPRLFWKLDSDVYLSKCITSA